MLDSNLCPNDGTTLSGIEKLKKLVSAFKESLSTSDKKIHEIELNTWEQRINLVVSSKTLLYQFIFIQASPPAQGTDPPDSLVLQILQAKQFSTPATQWGISNEL